jgi:hypothetical protein
MNFSKELTVEEKTQLLMELGHILDVHTDYWQGNLIPYPEDLGITNRASLPHGIQPIQVLSNPWVKNFKLLRTTVHSNHIQEHTYGLNFGGIPHRYVFDCAAPIVIDLLDRGSDRIKDYYAKDLEAYKLLQSTARQIISKGAPNLWKMVGHMVKSHKSLTGEMPEGWRAMILENIMVKRFPSLEKLKRFGYTYSMYRPTQGPLTGKYLKASPGLVEDTSIMSRDLLRFTGMLMTRLITRIKEVTQLKDGDAPAYMAQVHVAADLVLLTKSYPIDIPGYQYLSYVEQIRRLNSTDADTFRLTKKIRTELAETMLALLKVLQGKWAEERAFVYRNAFGPPKS